MADPRSDELHVEMEVQRNFTEARRLDHYVASRLPHLSRAVVQRLILEHALSVNGKKAKASHKVKPGDLIVVDIPEELGSRPIPEDIPLDVLHEDDSIVVLNKQAGIIVHPGRGKDNWSGTLTNALQFHFDRLSTIGGDARPGIVHRLDRDTSGVLIIAKDDVAHRNLGLQFEHRRIHKEYLAICYGIPDRDRDYIELPIGKHPTVREKMAVRMDPLVGKPATTFYEVMERYRGYALIRMEPLTGRTHQLRVHLESIKIPIVADRPYSGRRALKLSEVNPTIAPDDDAVLIERQALHAHRIRFRHPITHEEMSFVAPFPADFERTLAALRGQNG